MDDILTERYRVLWLNYGMGSGRALLSAKEQIHNAVMDKRLRVDGALYLLVNLDHMILRPYFAYIPDEESRAMSIPRDWKQSDIEGKLVSATKIILNSISAYDEPASSHRIMRAIESVWDELSQIFEWA